MRLFVQLWLLLALVVVGCGGSGEGGSVATTGTFAVFARGAEDANIHLFATLVRVDLMAGSSSTVLLDDPSGKPIDLRSLVSADGPRFQLITLGDVPRGQYDAVVLTFARSLQVWEKDSPTAVERTFDDSLDVGKDLARVRVPLEGGLQVGAGRTDLVLLFDLPAWGTNQDKVLPAIKVDRTRDVANRDRHVEQVFSGVIESESGNPPDTSLSLRLRAGSLRVRCGAATLVANADGSAAPLAKPGSRARVVGRFDPQGGQVLASSVWIGEAAVPTLEGRPTKLDAGSGMLELAWSGVSGGVPASSVVKVSLGDGVVVRGPDGTVLTGPARTEALAAAERLRAGGVFDGKQMAATTIEVLGAEAAPAVLAEGAAAAKEGALEIRLEAWDGFAGKPEQRVQVRLADDCRFFDDSGNPISRAQFQESSKSEAWRLRVVGRWSGGSLLAVQARILGEKGPASTIATVDRGAQNPQR